MNAENQAASGGILGAVAAGALICVAAQVLFAAVGGSIGLQGLGSDDLQGKTLGIGMLAYASVALLVAFFIGGYSAGRISGPRPRSVLAWQGLTVWSLVVVAFTLFVGVQALSLGGTLARAGAGAGLALGSGTSMSEISEAIAKMRIVTDMSIMKGKAITQIEIPKGSSRQQAGKAMDSIGKIPEKAKKAVDDATKRPEVRTDVREAAGQVRQVAASSGWAASAGLLLSAAMAALGCVVSRGRSLKTASR